LHIASLTFFYFLLSFAFCAYFYFSLSAILKINATIILNNRAEVEETYDYYNNTSFSKENSPVNMKKIQVLFPYRKHIIDYLFSALSNKNNTNEQNCKAGSIIKNQTLSLKVKYLFTLYSVLLLLLFLFRKCSLFAAV
jgi:hypothetical protein